MKVIVGKLRDGEFPLRKVESCLLQSHVADELHDAHARQLLDFPVDLLASVAASAQRVEAENSGVAEVLVHDLRYLLQELLVGRLQRL